MTIERSAPMLLAAALLASGGAVAEGNYPPTQTTPPPPGSSASGNTTQPASPSMTAPPTSQPAPSVTAPSAPPPGTGAGAATSGGTSGGASRLPTDDTALVLIVPASMANDPTLANGCWARLYDRTNFRGDLLPIAGNVGIADTQATFVSDYELGRNFDSLLLGPHATLTVWDGPNYGSRKTIFGQGESVSDLDSRMSDMQDIRSIRLTCTP